MSKFRGIYRVESARLKGYDYGRNGSYFVTICTRNRKEYFGEIIESPSGNYLKPTPIGQIAIDYWKKIPEIFPFIKLDEFVFMPNHMHGIIIISKAPVETHEYASPHEYASRDDMLEIPVETHKNASPVNECRTETIDYDLETHGDETHIDASLPLSNIMDDETDINLSLQASDFSEPPSQYQNKFGSQSKNLSSVLRGYKGAVKAFATTNKIEFDWQKRFYDHIIRDEKEFQFIRDYIRSNPRNWRDERNNPEGLYF